MPHGFTKGNNTENCKVRLIKLAQEFWFEIEENLWKYAVPQNTNVDIFRGLNHTRVTLSGSGTIRLESGMVIITQK